MANINLSNLWERSKQRLSYRSLTLIFFYKRQTDWKGHYTLAHFLENCKKCKFDVTGPKKYNCFNHFQRNFPKIMFFRSCDLISNFLALFYKMNLSIATIPVIWFYKILCSSHFFGWTSLWGCSQGSLGGWVKISLYKTCR